MPGALLYIMNLDMPSSVIRDERVKIKTVKNRQMTKYASVISAGDPVSGGALNARQDGDQYTLRFLKVDYPDPQVHDKLTTTNHGELKMKQSLPEGEFWACLCTGSVRGGRDL